MSILVKGRNVLNAYPFLVKASSLVFNKTIGFNKSKIRGESNKIYGLNQSFLMKSRIRISGKGNSISIGKMSFLDNCSFYISGNNNNIVIGDNVRAIQGDFYIEDDNNNLIIDDSTAICGFTHIAVTEGKTVKIGKDCMFSSDVTIRTGDSHSIISSDGLRINHAEDIFIGNHVWLGNKTTILKGSKIQSNSIVGTGSIVTKAFEDENVILVGNPAKAVREDMNWIKERI